MKQPRICVSIIASDTEESIEKLHRVEVFGADLIEIRFDYVESAVNLVELRAATELPLIATNRLREEGGRFRGSEEERIARLLEACEAGFNYVDIELAASDSIDGIKGKGAGLIISYHDLSGTPPIATIEEILDVMLEFKPDICKIIGTAMTVDDNLTYIEIIRRARARSKIVSFGMGEVGLISRVLSPLFGGEYTYASVTRGMETAPGQMPVDALREVYRLLGV